MDLDNYLIYTLKIVFANKKENLRLYRLRNRTILGLIVIILTFLTLTNNEDEIKNDIQETIEKNIEQTIEETLEIKHELRKENERELVIERTLKTKEYIVIVGSSKNRKRLEDKIKIMNMNLNIRKKGSLFIIYKGPFKDYKEAKIFLNNNYIRKDSYIANF